MGASTGIQWCDSSINFWEGCTEVSTAESRGGGCTNCYARALNQWLHNGENWGPGAPRRKHANARNTLLAWQRGAARFHAKHGRRRRVFINSTSDTFDNEVPDAWRDEIWQTMRETPDILYIVVTKRIGNAKRMLPPDWSDGYPNVIVVITVVNQAEADRDVTKLLALPARWRGLSVEPMLGPIDLIQCGAIGTACDDLPPYSQNFWPEVDWVINGFESGRRARPGHLKWARDLRDQAGLAEVALFYKQNGEFAPVEISIVEFYRPAKKHVGERIAAPNGELTSAPIGDRFEVMRRIGLKTAGRLLDGVEHNEHPKDFA